jgi:hypothetical protein
MSKYPNSGIISDAKTRVHPNSPDMNGDITIDKSLLRQMMDEQDGDEIKIKLSGWKKEGAYGAFISIKVNTYKPPVADAAPQQRLVENPDAKTATPVDQSDVPF